VDDCFDSMTIDKDAVIETDTMLKTTYFRKSVVRTSEDTEKIKITFLQSVKIKGRTSYNR
jgi:hypothetical protein